MFMGRAKMRRPEEIHLVTAAVVAKRGARDEATDNATAAIGEIDIGKCFGFAQRAAVKVGLMMAGHSGSLIEAVVTYFGYTTNGSGDRTVPAIAWAVEGGRDHGVCVVTWATAAREAMWPIIERRQDTGTACGSKRWAGASGSRAWRGRTTCGSTRRESNKHCASCCAKWK